MDEPMDVIGKVLGGPPEGPEEDDVFGPISDFMDNGGTNPATSRDIRLVLGAVRLAYQAAQRSGRQSQKNARSIWAIGIVMTALVIISAAVRHNDLVLINLAHAAHGVPPINIFP